MARRGSKRVLSTFSLFGMGILAVITIYVYSAAARDTQTAFERRYGYYREPYKPEIKAAPTDQKYYIRIT